MADFEKILPDIRTCYKTLPSMMRKFDKYGRKDFFAGETGEELLCWQADMRALLYKLLGLDKMEMCPLHPVTEEVVTLPGGIVREHVRIQVEPDVWMPMYILIPENAGSHTRPFLCPPGHGAGGKYGVAGVSRYRAVREKIEFYGCDYGMQLAGLGYVAVCPDSRGFGERREDLKDTQDPVSALKSDCYRLAHMGEPLGIPVAGMTTWDLSRALDYVRERGQWDVQAVSCLGFSGGGLQTLFFSAIDQRVSLAVISGYFYGYRDALLGLNNNCSCNYVPHLWEHLDMGDIACLIAPRPLLIQSGRADRLNGARGIANVVEQVDIARKAYEMFHVPRLLVHEICDGPHRWYGDHLEEHLRTLIERSRKKPSRPDENSL